MGQVLWVLSADLGAILLALTAGLVASAFTREWVRAVLLTAILTVALLLVHQSMLRSSVVTRTIGTTVITTVAMASTARLLWLPLALFAMAMLIAQRRLRDASLDESLSKRKLWLLQTFCRPVLWKEKFRVLMNRSLDRNPIGWLHQYSWSARLTKWGWCFVVIALETHLVSTSSWMGLRETQFLLGLWLAAGLAFVAAGSFRRERQTGALELILVTPMQVRDVIVGRLKGIWNQFLPATLVFMAAIWSIRDYSGFSMGSAEPSSILPLVIICFITIPVFGLYFSLQRNSFIIALLMTCLTAAAPLFIPLIVLGLIVGMSRAVVASPLPPNVPQLDEFSVLWMLIGQLILGWLMFHRLERDLAQRRFPLQQQVASL